MAFSAHTLGNKLTAAALLDSNPSTYVTGSSKANSDEENTFFGVVWWYALTCSCIPACTQTNVSLPSSSHRRRFSAAQLQYNIQNRLVQRARDQGKILSPAEHQVTQQRGKEAAHLQRCGPEVRWTCPQCSPLRSGLPPAAQRAPEHDQ